LASHRGQDGAAKAMHAEEICLEYGERLVGRGFLSRSTARGARTIMVRK